MRAGILLWSLDQGLGRAEWYPLGVQTSAALYLRGAVYLGAESTREAYALALSMAMSDAAPAFRPPAPAPERKEGRA